jgi:hypothetical protein
MRTTGGRNGRGGEWENGRLRDFVKLYALRVTVVKI